METITVQKKVFENFVTDLELLLADFEKILDATLQMGAEGRLHELKEGKLRPLNEHDYKVFIKKMGIKDG